MVELKRKFLFISYYKIYFVEEVENKGANSSVVDITMS